MNKTIFILCCILFSGCGGNRNAFIITEAALKYCIDHGVGPTTAAISTDGVVTTSCEIDAAKALADMEAKK